MTMANAVQSARFSVIPWIFVMAFGVVILVNTILVVAATRSATGLIVSRPYEKGIAYNRQLERERSQSVLGWHVEIQRAPEGAVTARIKSAQGTPVDGLAVTATFVRPVEGGALEPVALVAKGDGQYAAHVSLPRRGQWEVTVVAERDGARSETVRRWIIP